MKIEKLLVEASRRNLTKEEAVALLNIDNKSDLFYELIKTANRMTREEYDNKAYIFSQIGLNASPCSKNCKFCSMAQSNYVMEGEFQKTMEDIDDILETVRQLVKAGTHDVFLMTTADYPVEEFLKIGAAVKGILPEGVRLVANIGDFDEDTAQDLLKAGFTGVYHIRRLGEGKDTDIDPARRIKTLEVIREAGLELYYCVEPIGPEHTYEEIADEMLRAREYDVKAMAVMRRTPVPGTPMAEKGMISACELTKIEAVTRLVSKPSRSMNTHEVTPMTLIAGVNQLYAEVGANPRDHVDDTAGNRGYGVIKTIELLQDAEFEMA
ncbi:radical SAM protein [Zhenpiania hominis]|uniref:radical SAM protein n=1 Tax=Zhenpiania hominis TaxID=2763644 RepID=UPI0039F4A407